MGRLGLILVAILGAFFAYQTMDAVFDYDKASAQERANYLARAGKKLSNSGGFRTSMSTTVLEVKGMVPSRKVTITLQEPTGFVLNTSTRRAEMQRKCPLYTKSTLARNNIKTRVRFMSAKGRALGSVELSPSRCLRFGTGT